MRKSHGLRALCVLLIMVLLPFGALAVTTDDTPVTRSDFDLKLSLYPEGFPEGTKAHLADWKDFLSGLSLRGTIDTQSFLQEFSRVYMKAALNVNDRSVLPFEYDGYYSFRYLRSPALAGASVHFQMMNFFQFMLKGFNYMELPTDLIALLLYPEATQAIGKAYYTPVRDLLYPGEDREISREELDALCETLSAIAIEDQHFTVSDWLYCLLVRYSDPYLVQEKLCALQDVLDAMDPEGEGMTISTEGDTTVWTLGGEPAFTLTQGAEGTEWNLHLYDLDGYAADAVYGNTGDALNLSIALSQEEETRISAALEVTGIDPTNAAGEVTLTFGGENFISVLEAEPEPIRFRYTFTRSQPELPYNVELKADWLHPVTGQPAMGLVYQAKEKDTGKTAIPDHPIDNQDDFFHLNESYLAEYKERFTPTLIAGLVPVALRMPAGVIQDLYDLLDETGLISFVLGD